MRNSKKNKPEHGPPKKGPKGEAKHSSPESAPPTPAIKPPGVVHKGTHGLQGATLRAKSGVARLAELLALSADVPIDRLCDEAANRIEAKKTETPAVPWPDED